MGDDMLVCEVCGEVLEGTENIIPSPRVKHERKVVGAVQKDIFRVEIPVDILSAAGANTLFSWAIEEFDAAAVDWIGRMLVLEYSTKHYLPEGYVVEDLEEVL